MNPEQLAKPGTEHSHQVALFAWANMARLYGFRTANDMTAYTAFAKTNYAPQGVAVLEWLHAIPNGGFRDIVTAGKLKAEGVKPGIADIFFPCPRLQFAGLYIELKKFKGVPTKEQLAFQEYARRVGYAHEIVEGWRAAADVIERYLA